MEQLQQFFNILPPELQEKIAMLEPEEQQQVLMDLMQRYQDSQSEYAQMGVRATPRLRAEASEGQVPVEAERNETVTTQDGTQPQVEGGYLKKISENPISGQATYEIPNNSKNNTHNQIGNGSPMTGVNMMLREGDVVNSDKTIIPTDIKIQGRNFKGKTFKQASDYISKRETEIQKEFESNAKKGKVDKVSEGSIALMLAKLAKERNELNELQEMVLDFKKESPDYAEYGSRIPYILDFQMPNYQYDNLSKGKSSAKIPTNVKDRMVNTYQAPYPVINAQNGASIANQLIGKGMIPMEQFMQMTSGIRPTRMGSTLFAEGEKSNVSKPPQEIYSKILNASLEREVDPALMLTMAKIESGFNKNAVSKSGATGIFQFMPETGKAYGLIKDGVDNRKNVDANINAGAELMKDNIEGLKKNGLPINAAMIYLAHQQGLEGAKQIFKSATEGTPLPDNIRKNMKDNFGDIPADQYIKKTSEKVMGLYNAFSEMLDKEHEKSTYEAFSVKQNYQLPYEVSDISNEIFKTNLPNVMSRLRKGGFNITKSYEEPTESYNYGGSVSKPYSMTIPGSDYMGRRKDYILDANYNYGGKIYADVGDVVEIQKALDEEKQKALAEEIQPQGIEELPEAIIKPEDPWYTGPYTEFTGFNYSKRESTGGVKPKYRATPEIPPEKENWLDRIRYGLDEMIPYLDNLRLLREGRIMPVLQQKPYYNPYESMRTDVNIQSALNDIDRNTLTAMSDTRGNPAVRNARMAQTVANAQSAKNQLYTQKYNMEQQLENQKLLGTYDYLNKWTDLNMNLRKRYEQEVLQTIENQRQQQHMALQKIADDYLRGKENKQAIALATMESPYKWNPYTQSFVFDPIKAKEIFAYQQMMSKAKGNEYKVPEGYELKYKLEEKKKDKEEKGGTIKKKKLSLKAYG